LDSPTTLQSWFEESRPYFASLSGAVVGDPSQRARTSTDDADETICGTLQSLQQWMAANPCPDWLLADRINVLAARYGYRRLVGDPGHMAPDDETCAVLNERPWALHDDLIALVAWVEQVEADQRADRTDD
jgi:hypothetical protein